MLTDSRVEDIECGKYHLVFASAKNDTVKPFLFLDEKKQPHRFTVSHASLNQIMVG